MVCSAEWLGVMSRGELLVHVVHGLSAAEGLTGGVVLAGGVGTTGLGVALFRAACCSAMVASSADATGEKLRAVTALGGSNSEAIGGQLGGVGGAQVEIPGM